MRFPTVLRRFWRQAGDHDSEPRAGGAHGRTLAVWGVGLGLALLLSLLAGGKRATPSFAGSGDDGGGTPTARSVVKRPPQSSDAGWKVTMPPSLVPRAAMAIAVGRDANGSIYAIGGQDIGANPLPNVDVYNPVAGTWTAGPPLHDPRRQLAAAVDDRGRIYAIGGDDGAIVPTVEMYDPSVSTEWTTVMPLHTARRNLAAVTGSDGMIYAIGGYNDGVGKLDIVEVYDPKADAWTDFPFKMAQRLSRAGAAADTQGRIWIVGGQSNNCDLQRFCATSQVSVYEPGSSGWADRPGAALSPPREQLGSSFSGDRLYAISGAPFVCDSDRPCQCDPASCNAYGVDAYDPVQGWTNLTSVPTPLIYTGTAMGKDGSIYVIGGTDGFTPSNVVQIYNPSLANGR